MMRSFESFVAKERTEERYLFDTLKGIKIAGVGIALSSDMANRLGAYFQESLLFILSVTLI